jgi:hypothetical protein
MLGSNRVFRQITDMGRYRPRRISSDREREFMGTGLRRQRQPRRFGVAAGRYLALNCRVPVDYCLLP